MASLALGALGATIGGFAGGPQGAMLGWSAGTLIGGILFPPSLGEQGKLDSLKLTGSGYGAAIPQVWGKTRVGGNIIWVATDSNGNMLVEHSSRQSQGGKGGVGGGTVTNYSYTASIAVAICRGPITSVDKIWAEGEVIYDDSASPKTKHNVRVKLGTTSQLPDTLIEAALGAGYAPAYRGTAYVVFENLDLSEWGNRLPQLSFEVTAPNATVGGVLKDVFEQVGMVDGTDFDVSAATDAVKGLSIGARTEARSAIESMLRFYETDLSEIDGKVVAIKRGGASTLTVQYDELGARVGDGEPPSLAVVTREQDVELPRRVDLNYFDQGNNFEQGTQGATRQTKAWIREAVTEQTNLTLTADEARQGAERALYRVWNEREYVDCSLPLRHLATAPGRVITLRLPTGDFVGRVASVSAAVPGPIVVRVVKDRSQSTLVQTVPGGSSPANPVTVSAVVPTTFYPWSGREVRDQDTLQAGFYVVGTGAAGWRGATVYYSADGGASYERCGALTDRGEFGTCNTVLGDGSSTTTWDAVNTVDVTLQVQGSLQSNSQSSVLNNTDVNKALVGSEIIAYATATLVSGLRYTLSSLRRGYRGSPMTGHGASEKWVHLTTAVVRVTVPASLVGQSLLVKCVSPGESLSSVAAQPVTIAAPNQVYATVTDVASAVAAVQSGCLRPVRAVSSTNLTLSGTQTVDGVALVADDRVLVNGQTTASQNGVYVVAAGAWARAADADTGAEMGAGTIVPVSEGTAGNDTLWQLSTNGAVTVGTTALSFVKLAPSSGGGGGTDSQYYRMRGYVRSGSGVLLDSTYFDVFGTHANLAGNTVRKWKHYEGANAGSFVCNYATDMYLWGRLGVENTTGSDVTIDMFLAGHDDSLVVLLENPDTLAGTINMGSGSISGFGGTAFLTDFAVGDYIVAGPELLRITAVSSNSAMSIANTPSALALGITYKKAKKVYASTSSASPNASYPLAIKAGKQMVVHVLANSNGQPNFVNALFENDGALATGLSFFDPGA